MSENTKPLFCISCGVEIDIDDVDANLCTWGHFRGFCSDCIEGEE